jgi:hypothetical protein
MIDTTATIHSGRKGDTVVVAAHRVGHSERIGEILEVLGEPGHVHYRVRWQTGSETVLYPSSDASIRPKPRRSAAKR